MNTIETGVYTVADEALSLAAKLYDNLAIIRYDPVGASSDDLELAKEIRGLLSQALERSNAIRSNTGKG